MAYVDRMSILSALRTIHFLCMHET